MAIKVNGTTVVDDSRVLSNVTGLKTINSTSILGSGNISAGASTDYGAVGTYLLGAWGTFSSNTTPNYVINSSTYGGGPSNLFPSNTDVHTTSASAYAVSGSWRTMGNQGASGKATVWVRIA